MATVKGFDEANTMHGRYQVPDKEIKVIDPSHVYVPARGYSAGLIVFDLNDHPIGWIDTRTLGYENAKAWMLATMWRDGGY